MDEQKKYASILNKSTANRKQATDRMYSLMQARAAYTQKMQARIEEEMVKAQQERVQQQIVGGIGSTLAGAGMGLLSSGGNPFGALAGAGMGLAGALTQQPLMGSQMAMAAGSQVGKMGGGFGGIGSRRAFATNFENPYVNPAYGPNANPFAK